MLAAIILAAGQSRRMGTQKLLLSWEGQTVVGHIVDRLIGLGMDPVVVVVGADASRVSAALGNRQVQFVTNPDPAAEMLSSVRCGLKALPANCTAAMVALGDQPAIRAELIGELIRVHASSPDGIIVPVYGGKRGHPIIIPSRYFPEVLAQYDGVGLRGLLEAHSDDVQEVATNDAAVLDDLDVPEDYRRAVEATQGDMESAADERE